MKPANKIPVWDLPTRLFHWLLVALVANAWLTYKFGDIGMYWHKWNGYALLVLLLFRIIWGIIGSSTARFRDFVRGPARVISYLREGGPSLGHNPAGGWSVIAMLALLTMQAVAGLFATDDIIVSGPLKFLVSSDTASALSNLHRQGYYILLALVALHVAALLFYRFVKRDNLILPMITGYKQASQVPAGSRAHWQPAWLALLVTVLAALFIWFIINVWRW